MEFGFEPVCDQLRTSFEPASAMEFGFYGARPTMHCQWDDSAVFAFLSLVTLTFDL